MYMSTFVLSFVGKFVLFQSVLYRRFHRIILKMRGACLILVMKEDHDQVILVSVYRIEQGVQIRVI